MNETGTDAETHEKALTTPVRGLRTTRRASVGNPTSESCEVLTHHEPIGASVDLTNTTSALYETDSEESGEEFRTTRRHLPATRQQTDRRHHTVESDGRAPEGLGGKGSASLGDYLAAIGKVSRLTRVDEVALARSIQAGLAAAARLRELKSTCGPDGVPFADRRRQERLVARGQRARTQFIEANLRLVVFMAKPYRKPGVSFLDLIQGGNLGLMRAVDGFDHRRGVGFAAYATHWIRKAIACAIDDNTRTIRVPAHVVEAINKLARVQRLLVQELGREPTVEELALGSGMTVARVWEIQRINQETASLDQPMGDNEDISICDITADRAALEPATEAERLAVSGELKEALSQISTREQEVVRLRFGVDDGQGRTLKEVGEVLRLTREAVRQIESKALLKLRCLLRSHSRHDYLG